MDLPEYMVNMLQYKKDNTSPIKNYWILGGKSSLVLDSSISELERKMVKISHKDGEYTFRNYEIISEFIISKSKNVDGKILIRLSFNLI